MKQIFVSHSSDDAVLAEELVQNLASRRADLRFHLSSDHALGPAGGTAWQAWISNAITNSDLVVFVASESSKSVWCSAELGMARLLRKPLLPLATGKADAISPLLGHIQAMPLDQPIDALLLQVENLLGPVEPASSAMLAPGYLPYPGLDPLTEEQSELLVGRSSEVGRILADLQPPGPARLMIVSGPSGSGKSSLVRAGVVAAQRRRGWHIAGPFQPRQMADHLPDQPTKSDLSLVVVDQAEELLVLDPEARTLQTRWVAETVEAGSWVLLVLRSEFRAAVGQDLPKPVDHYVPFLTRDDLYEVVRTPAKLANLAIDESLVDRLVGETGSGQALPLLSLTLHELWKQRDLETNQLLSATLDGLGGVRGVLTRLAEEALVGATEGDALLVDDVLALLTRLAVPDQRPPTRSPIRAQSLTAAERAWLDRFVANGLVAYRTSYSLDDRVGTGVSPSGDHVADVTHEAIFDWAPLATAIDRERNRNQQRAAIERTARLWNDGGRADQTLLVSGDRLRFAVDENLASVDPLLREFLGASIRQDRERRGRRLLTIAAVVGLIVAIAAASYAFLQQREASTQRDLAVVAEASAREAEEDALQAQQAAESSERAAQALRMAAQATAAIDTERDFAMLAAVAAYRHDPGPETTATLLLTLSAPIGPLRYFGGPSESVTDQVGWSSLAALDSTRGVVAVDGRLSVMQFGTDEITELGTGSELDHIRIDASHRVPNSLLLAFRGIHENGASVAGTFDFSTSAVLWIERERPIRSVVANDRWLLAGDFDGEVVAAPRSQSGSGVVDAEIVVTHGGQITDMDLSLDGSLLAVASTEGITLNRQTTEGWGDTLGIYSSGGRGLQRLAFRRDNAGSNSIVELYAAGTDPTVHRWTLEAGEVQAVEQIGAHVGGVLALAVHPEEPLLVTAGIGGRIQRWNPDAGTELGVALLGHDDDVASLDLVGEPGSALLISTDENGAILWDLAPARSVERAGVVPPAWREEAVSALVSGPGPVAVVTTNGRVLIEDGSTRSGPRDAWRGWWAGDSVVIETRNLLRPEDGVTVTSTSVEDVTTTLVSQASAVDVGTCFLASAVGSRVDFREIGGCGTIPGPIDLGAFGFNGLVVGLRLSADEQRIAVAVAPQAILVLDVTSGLPIGEPIGSTQKTAVTELAWYDENTLVVGHDIGGDLEVIDVIRGQIAPVDAHSDAIRFIAADPERQRVLAGSEDGTISQVALNGEPRVTARFTARQRQKENDDGATVFGLVLDPAENKLLALHGSQLVAWELDPERLVAMACQRAGRKLTSTEELRLNTLPTLRVCGR